MSTISENVATVKANIAAAALSSGRNPEDIILCAATKMNDASRVQEAIRAGVPVCGENRVQELMEKNEQNAYAGSRLHFIGVLQKNKVKYLVGTVELIHSISDMGLLHEVNRIALKKNLVQDVLIEINIGGEASKSGFLKAELPAVLSAASELQGVRIRGLMAIPPACEKSEENRPYFAQMKQLFIDNCDKKYDNVSMDFLSMGMSGDYCTAISCGANIVRVGSSIFGARIYPPKQQK